MKLKQFRHQLFRLIGFGESACDKCEHSNDKFCDEVCPLSEEDMERMFLLYQASDMYVKDLTSNGGGL